CQGRIELQKLSNVVISSENVVESQRLSNACNVLDRMPERISFSTLEFDCSECMEEVELGIGERRCFADINTPDDCLGGCCVDGVPDLCSSASNVIDRHHATIFLSFCSGEGCLELGKICHGLVIKNGLCGDKFVCTSLVNMYAKCSVMEDAVMVYQQMPYSDIASRNCLISGYASNGLFNKAFGFFIESGNLGIWPNHYSYSIMLTACGNLLAIQEGKQFHAQLVKTQYLSKTAVANALLTMYSKCGMMKEAETLFQNISQKSLVSWSAIMSGLFQHKSSEKALSQFYLMRDNGIEPNEHTFTIALASCGSMKHLDCGRALHCQVIKSGMVSSVFVGTTVIDMYAELGEMGYAETQLQEMGGMASNVSWNALVAGFVRNKKTKAALEAFHNMVKDDTACDEFTYSVTLTAWSLLPSLATCKQIHSRIVKANFGANLHVGSSLVEAYAKCGNLKDAKQVFHKLSMPDVVLWNSMIKAHSQYGHPKKSMSLFTKMIKEKIKPNSSTFLAILSACSHAGLVQEGQEFFEYMVREYNIPPEETHYSCMVDLLGRSVQLEKALDFVNNLPIKPTAPVWRSLLAACRCHGNLQLAELVGKHILALDPKDATVYVTLSNMYAEVGRHFDAERQRVNGAGGGYKGTGMQLD
ncbi:unnamed protein product, partial [Ilex paraguariensis]